MSRIQHAPASVRTALAAFILSLITAALPCAATEWLGPMTPKDALAYMQKTPDLLVVDVRDPQWIKSGFVNAVNIPWTDLDRRFKELPADRPILLHCGAGVVVPRAYEILRQQNPELKSVGYIEGTPLFDEYNRWKQNEGK